MGGLGGSGFLGGRREDGLLDGRPQFDWVVFFEGEKKLAADPGVGGGVLDLGGGEGGGGPVGDLGLFGDAIAEEEAGEVAEAGFRDFGFGGDGGEVEDAAGGEAEFFAKFDEVLAEGDAGFEDVRAGEEDGEKAGVGEVVELNDENRLGSGDLDDGGEVILAAAEGGAGFGVEAEDLFAAHDWGPAGEILVGADEVDGPFVAEEGEFGEFLFGDIGAGFRGGHFVVRSQGRIGKLAGMSIVKAILVVLGVGGVAWGEEMVLVQREMPGLLVDMRYAGVRNITGRALYADDRAWLRPEAVRRLKLVQGALRKQGLQLVLWDAYRPPAAHLELWRAFPNANFVASPKLGSRHSRGTTVDVGLADLQGRLVEVPTDHDVFGPLADHDLSDVPAAAARHVELLRRAMFDHGWSGVPAEWWHYDLRDWKNYPVIERWPR